VKQKFYAYLTDKEKGVTNNWDECRAVVSGVTGARFKGFTSREEAQKWLEAGADYSIKHIIAKKGIYFDAGTGTGNGVEISVTDEKGKSLLGKILPKNKINNRGFCLLPKDVTNNFGELLALKHALQIAINENIKNIFATAS